MSASRRVVHGSLTQTLRLDVIARAAFAAFSDRSLRVRWFRIPAEPGTARHELFLDVDGDGSTETAEREGGTRLLLNRLRAVVIALATAG